MKKKLTLVKALSITAAVGLLVSANFNVYATTQQTNVLPVLNGFSTKVFTKVASSVSKPDDITTMGGNIFVGNQNGVGSDGAASSKGVLNSSVIEYDATGKQMSSWSIAGKCDGLKADTANNRLIATVNEDGNSSMYIITPLAVASKQVQHITFKAAAGQKLPSGGTDSISFKNGNIYISASAPKADSKGNFTTAALFQAVINADKTATLTSVLADNATANDATPGAAAGATTTLNMSDPDSNNIVPSESPKYAGQVVLGDQGDSKLIFSKNIGTASQVNTMLPVGTQVDDTVWATSTKGTLYITDTASNTIYSVTGTFKKGTAFVSAPDDAGVAGFVGTVDLTTGVITPVVTGMDSPHGLLFVPQLPALKPSTVYKNQYGLATGDGISIRTGAGTQYSWQGSFALGTKIKILGTAGSFYKVSYSGITGYVSNQYVKITAK